MAIREATALPTAALAVPVRITVDPEAIPGEVPKEVREETPAEGPMAVRRAAAIREAIREDRRAAATPRPLRSLMRGFVRNFGSSAWLA